LPSSPCTFFGFEDLAASSLLSFRSKVTLFLLRPACQIFLVSPSFLNFSAFACGSGLQLVESLSQLPSEHICRSTKNTKPFCQQGLYLTLQPVRKCPYRSSPSSRFAQQRGHSCVNFLRITLFLDAPELIYLQFHSPWQRSKPHRYCVRGPQTFHFR